MIERSVSAKTTVYVVIASMAALVARSWLQVYLRDSGMERLAAADLSYLIVPPIMLLLLSPLWKSERHFLANLFQGNMLTLDLVLRAVAIGLLARILWWAQLFAGGSFGWYSSNDPDSIVGPQLSFGCAAPPIVALGFIVMAILIPIAEEIIHRGYVQTALRRYGALTAVVASATVFTVFHAYDSWPAVFLMGMVLGAQFELTKSLWAPIISHATYNALIQVDWRCISAQWNPPADTLPLLLLGSVSVVVFLLAAAALLYLLKALKTEAP